MSEKLGVNDTEFVLDGIEYWVRYEYGRSWTDAPEEREFAWAVVVDCIALQEGRSVLIREDHMPIIEEHCLREASEILALPY